MADVRSLIEQARDLTSRAVNAALVMLYWSIGDRICRDVLKKRRAEYGQEVLPTLSANLTDECGRGYVQTLSAQLRLGCHVECSLPKSYVRLE